MTRRVRLMGDGAAIVDTADHLEAAGLATAVRARALPGILDVVPAAASVGIVVDALTADAEAVAEVVAHLSAARSEAEGSPRTFSIDVDFSGPDLDELAGSLRTTVAAVVEGIVRAELRVAWLGFMPGFPYLVGLPAFLGDVPRRTAPRPSVPAGSVAIGGGFAGIYPASSPGGWHLLGRTRFELFDWRRPPYAALRAGDRIHLRPAAGFESPEPDARRRLAAPPGPAATILEPGMQLMVQSTRRSGVASIGVPAGGAADPAGLRIVNRAVGNDDAAGALEVTGGGSRLRLSRDSLVAASAGVPLFVDGVVAAPGVVAAVGAGQLVEVGALREVARGLVAISGGVAGPAVLGSISSDAVSGLPPGPLRARDELRIGLASRGRAHLDLGRERAPWTLSVIPGPDGLDRAWLTWLTGCTFVVGEASDRTGVRLVPSGDGATRAGLNREPGKRPAAMPSHAVVAGAIQLPPQGPLIVLGPDCGPVGGYPVVATVITADLSRIGKMRPGDDARLSVVGPDEAARRLAALEAQVTGAVSGWYPTRFG